MKKIYPVFFTAIVFSFSALMLILSLLCSIKLTALKDAVGRVEEEAAALSAENERLLAKFESSVNIEELERIAVEELGMQKCSPGQIYYLTVEEIPG